MKLSIATLFAGSFADVAPSHVGKSSTALNAFDYDLGAQAPLGFFDPPGMLAYDNQEQFDSLRHVEVKQERIA